MPYTLSSNPIPVAGANTFFGQQSPISHANFVPNKATGLPTSQTTKLNIFGQDTAQAREAFRMKLAESIARVDPQQEFDISPPDAIAGRITETILQIRNEKALGFLPDNKQWRSLHGFLDHDRFVLAVLTGIWSLKSLALSDVEDLNQRVVILNELREGDFRARLSRDKLRPDPTVSKRKPRCSLVILTGTTRISAILGGRACKRLNHRVPWRT